MTYYSSSYILCKLLTVLMRYKIFRDKKPDSLEVIRGVRSLEKEGYIIRFIDPIYKKKWFGKKFLSTIVFYDVILSEW